MKKEDKSIYICTTYYHAYITCVKVLVQAIKCDIAIADYINDYETLSWRIKRSGIFDNVFIITQVEEYQEKGFWDFLFNYHKKNVELVNKQLCIDFREYQEIFIFHDNTWIARYLKSSRIHYNLIEDGLDSYKIIKNTDLEYMVRKKEPTYLLRMLLNHGHFFLTDCKYIKSFEVNDLNNLQIRKDKRFVVVPRQALVRKLSDENKKLLIGIFLRGELPNLSKGKKTLLLLTRPFPLSGWFMSATEHKDYYINTINEYQALGYNVFLKPHPRDAVSYNNLKDVLVFDKNMPIEILNFIEGIKFDLAIGYNTTALDHLTFAKEKLNRREYDL